MAAHRRSQSFACLAWALAVVEAAAVATVAMVAVALGNVVDCVARVLDGQESAPLLDGVNDVWAETMVAMVAVTMEPRVT